MCPKCIEINSDATRILCDCENQSAKRKQVNNETPDHPVNYGATIICVKENANE